MLRIIITLLFTATITLTQAQIKLGVTASYQLAAGKNCSYMAPMDNYRYAYKVDYLGHNNTNSFGLSLRKEFTKSYFNADFQYRKESYQLLIMDMTLPESTRAQQKFNITERKQWLHMPITAGFKWRKLKFGLGPQFSMLLDQSNTTDESTAIESNERTWQTGFHFDLAVQFKFNTELWLRHETAFAEVGDAHYYNGKKLRLEAPLSYWSIGCHVFFE